MMIEVFLFPAEQQLRTSHTQFEFYNTYLQGNSLVKLSKQYLKTLNHELVCIRQSDSNDLNTKSGIVAK